MGVILMFAGQTGPRVKLADCLREIHKEAKSSRQKEINKRIENRIPLDDSVRWNDVVELQKKLTEAITADDSIRVNEAARDMLERTSGALVPIGDLKLEDWVEEIEVVFRVLADARRRELMGIESAAWNARKAASERRDDRGIANAISAVIAARSSFVAEAVESIHGIDGISEVTPDALDAFARSGLLLPLYEAASFFQDLPAKKALRFGAPQESTYLPSTAQNAPSFGASNLVVTAEHESQTVAAPSFMALNTKRIHVQNGT